MSDVTGITQDTNTVSAQVRGETVAYAVQSGLFSLAANIYEPYISLLVQKKYANKYNFDAPAHQRYGTYTQNFTGELVGDLAGASSLILAEAIAPEELHRFTRGARKMIDPLFTTVAHSVFADEKDTPDYQKHVDEWKTFQERNFVRSGIIASTGTLGNLLTQKLLLKNPSPAGVIFAGKAASTALTTAIGLASRFCFPDQMKSMDSWISKRYLVSHLEDKDLDENHNQHVARLHTTSPEILPAR
ncbi:MAG: hypothetical protein ACK502_04115 [Alphaproteobacteria bacterium]